MDFIDQPSYLGQPNKKYLYLLQLGKAGCVLFLTLPPCNILYLEAPRTVSRMTKGKLWCTLDRGAIAKPDDMLCLPAWCMHLSRSHIMF